MKKKSASRRPDLFDVDEHQAAPIPKQREQLGALLREIAAALAAGRPAMTKITADQLARQGRAAFVTATHTLRGKSGKESPGDKSFIRAKGIRLTKIGERSNSNVAYADERDIAGLFCDEIPVEQCLPSASGGGLSVHNFRRDPTALNRPPVAAINHLPDSSENSELVLPIKVAKKKGCNGAIVTGVLAKL